MAQFNHRIDLSKSDFPLLSSELGRSVLVNNNRNTPTGEEENKPEILYCHNVMPTKRGLQSVGFQEIIIAPTGGDATVTMEKTVPMLFVTNDAATINFVADSPIIVAYTSKPSRLIYVTLETFNAWFKQTIPIPVFDHEPTVANAQGKSYILLDFNVPFFYSRFHSSFVVDNFIGSPLPVIHGITDAFGYLIAWGGQTGLDKTTDIVWSSLVNPLDLTPSAVTGAGTAKIEGAKGHILLCAPNSTGFLVYCFGNVVAAIYTGNKQYPFKFVPIEGSKGLGSSTTNNELFTFYPIFTGLVAYDSDSYGHFMFGGTGGLQLVNTKRAELTLPEVTDFLSGKILEDFDEATKTFSIFSIIAGENMLKKIAFIASRYLVISYGIDEFTHALVYDIILKKLGKIKFTHVDVFEHNFRRVKTGATPIVKELSKESIAFMTKTGSTSIISFNTEDVTREGVLILGKYQYVRDRHLVLQGLTAENVDAADSFTCTDMVSLDGRNTSSLVTGVETSGVGYREFAFNSSGKSHSFAFIGEFILNTLELLFTMGGRR